MKEDYLDKDRLVEDRPPIERFVLPNGIVVYPHMEKMPDGSWGVARPDVIRQMAQIPREEIRSFLKAVCKNPKKTEK
jgi:hypothetical protein